MPENSIAMVVHSINSIKTFDNNTVFISGVLSDFDNTLITDINNNNPFVGKVVKQLNFTSDTFIYLNFENIIETSIGINDPNVNFMRATNIIIPSGPGAQSFCVPLKGTPTKVSQWFPIRDIRFLLNGLDTNKVSKLTGATSPDLQRFTNEFHGRFEELRTPTGSKIKFQDETLNNEFRRFVDEAHNS